MTVRAWYRLQRGALWARGDRFAWDLERLTSKVLAGQPPDLWEHLGAGHVLVFNRERWDRSQETLEAVRRQMDAAMTEIHLELSRRAAIDRYTKDLTR
jgi:hypothetical protein